MNHNIVQRAIYVGVLVFAIVGTALAQTPVTACGTVINEPGTYALANDLTSCSTIPAALAIQASNVTLLLNGHTISGASGVFTNDGILMCCVAVTNVSIQGPGVITNFPYGSGVNFESASSSVATNITVTGCIQGFLHRKQRQHKQPVHRQHSDRQPWCGFPYEQQQRF